MEKMNAGFKIEREEIFEVGKSGAYGIALGHRETRYADDEWVTWAFTDTLEDTSYYWGHYFSDWASAYKDYHERLAREYERMAE